MTTTTSSTNLDNIDITKFLMSILIVAIHSNLGGSQQTSLIFPWARIAVPMFFVISAYLFFRKYSVADAAQKSKRLKKFAVRNLQLYAFWLVVLLIPTVLHRNYFAAGIGTALYRISHGFFFGSTFIASWYISATVIAIGIIALLMKKLPNWVMLVVFTGLYVFACLSCNYANLFSDNAAIQQAAKSLYAAIGYPYNNFVVALFWIIVGKVIAEKEYQIRDIFSSTRRKALLTAFLLLGCVLLFAEQCFIRSNNLAIANDCFLLLPLPVVALFILVLNTSMQSKHAKSFRTVSTVTYCLHGTFLLLPKQVLKDMGIRDFGIIEFLVTLAVCWLVSYLIMKLEAKPGFGILKYSH